MNELVAETQRPEIRPFQDADEMDTVAVCIARVGGLSISINMAGVDFGKGTVGISPRHSSPMRYLGWHIG